MSGSTEDLTTLRLVGRACGQQVARNTVNRVRSDLTLLGALTPALEDAEHAGADSLAGDGLTDAELAEWRLGYFEGAEVVVLTFLVEVQASSDFTFAQADALSALSCMEEAAKRIGVRLKPPALLPGLGGLKPGRLLRLGNFGALPRPPSP